MHSIRQRTGISLNIMKLYMKYLMDANLITLLYRQEKGINSLNKPEKIFLQNTNLMYSLAATSSRYGCLGFSINQSLKRC
jgi:predicted AAA+ superfamily ATPase